MVWTNITKNIKDAFLLQEVLDFLLLEDSGKIIIDLGFVNINGNSATFGNLSKNTTTFGNLSKNDVTFNNLSKNDTTFTNINKN